ncbi:Glia maturation factor gamma, partial [Ophiophagus hannah]
MCSNPGLCVLRCCLLPLQDGPAYQLLPPDLSFLCICRRVSRAEEQHILPRAEKHRIWSYKISTERGDKTGDQQGTMSDSLVVCDVDPALIEKLKKFRFQKETNNTALIMKVDKDRQLVVLEEEFQDISPEQLTTDMRTMMGGSLTHFASSSPVRLPEQQMMYAGSKNRLVQAAELTKVFEIRSTEELTEQWLKERLAFFR